MLTFLEFIDPLAAQKVANDWREHLWNRAGMSKLANHAVEGGSLHHFHPGNITVYRGIRKGSNDHTKTGTSWSKSKSVAKRYADGGKVHSMTITTRTPAVDVNKMLRGIPSKSTNDREIFIAKGNYRTSNG